MELGNTGASSILPRYEPMCFDLFAEIKIPLINRQVITAAVEQSVQRLVQQDAVDGIRPLPDVWRRILHVEGDYL